MKLGQQDSYFFTIWTHHTFVFFSVYFPSSPTFLYSVSSAVKSTLILYNIAHQVNRTFFPFENHHYCWCTITTLYHHQTWKLGRNFLHVLRFGSTDGKYVCVGYTLLFISHKHSDTEESFLHLLIVFLLVTPFPCRNNQQLNQLISIKQ